MSLPGSIGPLFTILQATCKWLVTTQLSSCPIKRLSGDLP